MIYEQKLMNILALSTKIRILRKHHACSFQEMTDSLAITTKGKENLVFAMGALAMEERVKLSYQKDEMIYKCSYSGSQCDIEELVKVWA